MAITWDALPTLNSTTFKINKMKEYKVEVLIYYTKLLSLDKYHVVKSSKKDIQEKLDEYAQLGFKLTSTDATNFGAAVYIYLYFERAVQNS